MRLSISTARFRRTTLYTRMVTQEVSHEIVSFKKDPEEYLANWEAAGILGTLGYWTDFESGIVSGAVISGG